MLYDLIDSHVLIPGFCTNELDEILIHIKFVLGRFYVSSVPFGHLCGA